MKFSKGDKVYYVGRADVQRPNGVIGVVVGVADIKMTKRTLYYAEVVFGKNPAQICNQKNLISAKQHALKEFFK